jgi:hypothetical protein
MVELELLQRGQRPVALLGERERPLPRVFRLRQRVLARRRLAEKRDGDEQHGSGCHQRRKDERDGHASANA